MPPPGLKQESERNPRLSNVLSQATQPRFLSKLLRSKMAERGQAIVSSNFFAIFHNF